MRGRVSRVALSLCGLFFGAALLANASRTHKLYPVDEGPKDRSFLAFRAGLVAAAKKRDQRFLLEHLDPRVLVSPLSQTGGRGIDEFGREWRPGYPESKLWPELIKILSLGGAFKSGEPPYEGFAPAGREFVAPYVRSQWPEELDTEEYGAIIGTKVLVRRRPSSSAQVVDVLSYDIVKTGEVNDDWVQITTPRGRRGYVSERLIRSPADTEAHFARKNDRWVMTGLFETCIE